MTEEQKQALIEWLKPQIDELQNVSDEITFGLDSDSAMHLNTMRVALSALTAQPVKLPESFYGVIQDGKVVMLPADDGQWLNKTTVIEAFRALEQRAEAAEIERVGAEDRCRMMFEAKNHWADRARAAEAKLAELEKQEHYVEVMKDGPTTICHWMKPAEELPDGAKLFARPAPAADLADLVPPERNKWEGTDEEGYDIDYMEPSDIYQMGKDEGFNLCRAAVLRNIEEAK